MATKYVCPICKRAWWVDEYGIRGTIEQVCGQKSCKEKHKKIKSNPLEQKGE